MELHTFTRVNSSTEISSHQIYSSIPIVTLKFVILVCVESSRIKQSIKKINKISSRNMSPQDGTGHPKYFLGFRLVMKPSICGVLVACLRNWFCAIQSFKDNQQWINSKRFSESLAFQMNSKSVNWSQTRLSSCSEHSLSVVKTSHKR